VFQTMDHWLELGVDGLRLDPIPTSSSATAQIARTCPNPRFPQIAAVARRLGFQGRLLLAEANQWPETR
jgi:maltose alpha-D-glucosyltransferase/alpha-amylase